MLGVGKIQKRQWNAAIQLYKCTQIFFQSLSLPLFVIHLKIFGTADLILLNQNINSHVAPV